MCRGITCCGLVVRERQRVPPPEVVDGRPNHAPSQLHQARRIRLNLTEVADDLIPTRIVTARENSSAPMSKRGSANQILWIRILTVEGTSNEQGTGPACDIVTCFVTGIRAAVCSNGCVWIGCMQAAERSSLPGLLHCVTGCLGSCVPISDDETFVGTAAPAW